MRLVACAALLVLVASCHGHHHRRRRVVLSRAAGSGAALVATTITEEIDSDSASGDDSDDDAPTFTPTSFAVDVHGSGRPIIFIPGLGCPGSVWDGTVAHLEGYQSHVLTLAGFAGQPALDPTQPLGATARAELAEYIRDRKLDHPIIVGHSLGGFLAYWLAESEPDIVGPTIVVDSGAALGGDDRDANVVTAKQARDLWANASDDQFTAQVHDIFSSMSAAPDRLEPTLALVAKSDRRALGDAIAEQFATDLRPDLGKIRAPVLVILADGGLQEAMRAQAQPVPHHDVVVVPHAKHFVMVDDPTAFYGALDGFLAAHPAAAGAPVAAI